MITTRSVLESAILVLIMLMVPADAIAKKEKKNEKEEKPLARMTMQELVDALSAIEYHKPSPTGTELDKMYEEAQDFHNLVSDIKSNVPIFELKKVINRATGDTILAPIDNNGNLRTSWEGVMQTSDALLYVTKLTTSGALLATYLVTYSAQIGVDALAQKTPNFLGGPDPESTERFKANKQIAKFKDAPHLIQMALKNQARLMTNYRRVSEAQTEGDGAVKTLPGEDFSDDQIISMSDEEIAVWLEKERSKAD